MCTGDAISAISKSVEIAELLEETVYLEFREGFKVPVHPQSYTTDLISIYRLKKDLEKLKTEN